MAGSLGHYGRGYSTAKETATFYPVGGERTTSATSGASYEEKRETIATFLMATAVLLLLIMAILMLIFVFISLGHEVHTITIEEATSDSPRMLTPLIIDAAAGRTLSTTGRHTETEYGIGIDHNFCRNETFMGSLVAEQTTKTSLYEMWSRRVHHYGQVNTPPILTGFDTLQYVKQSAKGLQMLSQLMKDKADSEHQPSYTVLHYPMMYESMAVDVAKALTAYPVDLFVAFGYTAYSDYGERRNVEWYHQSFILHSYWNLLF
ncbi:hypothetical protein MTO96_020310 [Rhipicephalus appendiculatus]